ncbi:restriction endonuclease subunit S [Vibrio sp. SCSIO 43132]|uniref:restriction endonuclease subunit S n=1 Tax=Vibrio sp. SCSIO 43132 TaxID=2779363 RepID=UPI001CA982EB|nr:restriction endonuclease subunit S [Vibrio sp. SCSIO 43132]UAB69236.1 restriction endonuclease subunit S [Vibrio sp. SCSIO 43132]
MSMTKNVPEIRFEKYKADWVKSDLGELISVGSAARVHKEQWTNHGVPFYRTSDVVSIYKDQANTQAFISYELYEQLTNKIGKIQRGDLLITGGGSIGIPFLVKNDAPLYFKDADLLWLKNNHKMDGHFLYTFFASRPFRNYLKSISHIGTIGHYTISQAKTTPISYCDREEQGDLGNYFQKLDTLINQHQQKHDKLTNLKKAMLEKMFPKAGESVPEIRFDGFTGNWTTTSLSKIAHVIDPHPSHRAPDAVANGVPFIGIGDVAENGHVDFKNVRIVPYHIYGEHRQRYQVEVGDFAYGRVASIGKIIDLSSNVDREYTYSPTMAIVKPVTLYSPYLKGYMNTSVFKGRVDNKTTGSTRKSLGVQDFRELPVCFPEQQEEQIKIGDYFQNLGLLINQHKHQITKLKNIKQACLDKMFV